jgi:hypothetical protein
MPGDEATVIESPNPANKQSGPSSCVPADSPETNREQLGITAPQSALALRPRAYVHRSACSLCGNVIGSGIRIAERDGRVTSG